MTKETVRYPDEVVEAVEAVADEEGGVFESKSEFYRFAAEYVLDTIRDDYDPESFDFEEIRAELEQRGDVTGPREVFLDAVLAVRKHGLRGEFDAAEAVIDDRYDDGDVEAVVLEELLGTYR